MGCGDSMKSKRLKITNIICGFFLIVLATSVYSKTLVIQHYKVKVRKDPVITGPSIGVLKHKDVVTEIERKKGFVRIQHKKLEGWIPLESVVVDKKVTIKKGKKIEAIDDEDVLAAGKGVGDVSNDKSTDTSKDSLGRKRLDEIETSSAVKPLEVNKFKASGDLKPARKVE
jgi:hypothetical protein